MLKKKANIAAAAAPKASVFGNDSDEDDPTKAKVCLAPYLTLRRGEGDDDCMIIG